MTSKTTILFVCEHGAAKSVIAAAYFNKLASEKRLNLQAIARGTNPDKELIPKAVKGLMEDGLQSTETTPQKLLPVDIEFAQRIITSLSSITTGEQTPIVSMSIGIACQSDEDNVLKVVEKADKAMYFAKQEGGNRFYII